ncbi:hypothetical protein [Streptacidiphilus jiangxiensis]|uniref:Uncharacterized protein n=1 Tax=Streptacidiphilus jiangxiensis TaxID=235985 RepID=A0A1H7S339_STRJI|nr:hypothetical protein [Streptacidiphilus jiangxiensis]SEL67002.1 hypothetical protein SAMN05414137_111129 [Streptacidiphilus jiangxiensis]
MSFDFLKGGGSTGAGVPGADPLESLREFVVKVEYGRHHTTFNVFDGGSSHPVVRMHKPVPYDVHEYYRVFPVAEPDRVLGTVVMGRGRYPDNRFAGGASEVRFKFGGTQFAAQQPEIGQMVGHKVGVTRLTDNWLGSVAPGTALTPYHLEFKSDSGPSFTFSRRVGVTSDYKITIVDGRVSRLAVLAWTEEFNREESVDWRKSVIDTTTNPLKTFGPEFGADAERRVAALKEAKKNRKHGS